MKRIVIYKIVNNLTGKIYVGQTSKKLNERWSNHKTNSKNGVNEINKAIREFDPINFTIIEICTALKEEHANMLESLFISYYNCVYPNGYNMTSGGIGQRGAIPETAKKMSEAKIGTKRTDSHKLHLSILNTGKKMSEESKFKLSQSNTGKKHSLEAKKKIPEAVKNRKVSSETKLKMSLAMKNKVISPETRQKMAESRAKNRLLKKGLI